jgi:hypothetical protein
MILRAHNLAGVAMDNVVSALPTHLDFTTLYASALALSSDDRKRDGLPLSRLLALSQLIESIVLHESLQYELGDTSDWTLYREKLENSIIPRLAPEFGVPLLPTAQVDAEESLLLIAIKRAARVLKEIPSEALNWSVQLRSGTYAAVREVRDINNPFTKRYLELARSDADAEFQENLRSGIAFLEEAQIGILGFHVLVRLLLHEAYWVASGRANYYPHFSRQPLFAVLGNAGLSVERWTMTELEIARHKITERVSSTEKPIDLLDRSLSPIFLACLARASNPEDIIDEANRLRNSDAAFEYRKERDEMLSMMGAGDMESLMHYKTRISLRLADLRDVLFERGSDQVYERHSLFRLPGMFFGWTFAMKKTQRVPRFAGDRAAIFIGDIILQSLGVIQASEKIREVFGTSVVYDTRVLSF